MVKLTFFLVTLALASAKPAAENSERNRIVIHLQTDLDKEGSREFFPNDKSETENIEFTLSAIGLPSVDPVNGAPDAFVEISGSLNATSGHVDDTNDPSWPEVFTVIYIPFTFQVMDIRVMDYNPTGSVDEIGWVKGVKVKSILSCAEQKHHIEGDRGHLVFRRYNCPENVTANAN